MSVRLKWMKVLTVILDGIHDLFLFDVCAQDVGDFLVAMGAEFAVEIECLSMEIEIIGVFDELEDVVALVLLWHVHAHHPHWIVA